MNEENYEKRLRDIWGWWPTRFRPLDWVWHILFFAASYWSTIGIHEGWPLASQVFVLLSLLALLGGFVLNTSQDFIKKYDTSIPWWIDVVLYSGGVLYSFFTELTSPQIIWSCLFLLDVGCRFQAYLFCKEEARMLQERKQKQLLRAITFKE